MTRPARRHQRHELAEARMFRWVEPLSRCRGRAACCWSVGCCTWPTARCWTTHLTSRLSRVPGAVDGHVAGRSGRRGDGRLPPQAVTHLLDGVPTTSTARSSVAHRRPTGMAAAGGAGCVIDRLSPSVARRWTVSGVEVHGRHSGNTGTSPSSTARRRWP